MERGPRPHRDKSIRGALRDAAERQTLGPGTGVLSAQQSLQDQGTGVRLGWEATAHIDLEQTLCVVQGRPDELSLRTVSPQHRHQHHPRTTVNDDITPEHRIRAHDPGRLRSGLAIDALIGGPRSVDQRDRGVRASRARRTRAGQQPSLRVQEQHRRLEKRAETPRDGSRSLLADHDLKQLLLRREAAPKTMHLLGGERVIDVLLDVAKERVSRHGEERETQPIRLLPHGHGDARQVVRDGYTETHHTCGVETAQKTRPLRGVLTVREGETGGEMHAAGGHPRRGVEMLADVDAPAFPVGAAGAGDELQFEARVFDQFPHQEWSAGHHGGGVYRIITEQRCVAPPSNGHGEASPPAFAAGTKAPYSYPCADAETQIGTSG